MVLQKSEHLGQGFLINFQGKVSTFDRSWQRPSALFLSLLTVNWRLRTLDLSKTKAVHQTLLLGVRMCYSWGKKVEDNSKHRQHLKRRPNQKTEKSMSKKKKKSIRGASKREIIKVYCFKEKDWEVQSAWWEAMPETISWHERIRAPLSVGSKESI